MLADCSMKNTGRRPGRRVWLVIAWATAATVLMAMRCYGLDAELTLQPTASSPWQSGIGNGFREDSLEAGLALGAGFGTRTFGTTRTHNLALGSARFSWIFSDVVGGDQWYRGNWEWWNEVFAGSQFYPQDHYFVGWTTGLRYDFATGSRWPGAARSAGRWPPRGRRSSAVSAALSGK